METVNPQSLLEIQSILLRALRELFQRDFYLIDHGLHECAISHRLAVYLEQHFTGWNVDCEYNRDGDDPKVPSESHRSRRSDICVHMRGKEGPNCLAVELKKSGDAIDRDDEVKAKRYVNDLHYRWAVCLLVKCDGVFWKWYSTDTESPGEYIVIRP